MTDLARTESARAVEVGALRPEEIDEAVGVLARGMRDNPIHVAALSPDPSRREATLRRMFAGLLRARPSARPLAARLDGRVVGVADDAPPGGCAVSGALALRLLPAIAASGPGAAARTVRWMNAWKKHDLAEPHAHYGPFAVDRGLQGRGIGSRILAAHTTRLDALREVGFLETDKPENVRLYERFGFEVIEEAPTLGVPCWWMRRPPAA